jgi:hypothetical protein
MTTMKAIATSFFGLGKPGVYLLKSTTDAGKVQVARLSVMR